MVFHIQHDGKILKWFDVVNETLTEFREPTVGHRVVITELVMLLKPFADTSFRLQGAYVSTMGIVLAELAGLYQTVRSLKTN